MLHRTSPKHEFAPSHFIATSIRSPYHSGTTTPSRFRWVEMKHILWSSSDILHQPMEDVMTAVSLVLLRFVCCFLFSCTFCALLLSSYLRLQPLRASSCRLARAVLRLCSLTSALSSVFFVWFVWWNGGNVVTDILSGLFASRSSKDWALLLFDWEGCPFFVGFQKMFMILKLAADLKKFSWIWKLYLNFEKWSWIWFFPWFKKMLTNIKMFLYF